MIDPVHHRQWWFLTCLRCERKGAFWFGEIFPPTKGPSFCGACLAAKAPQLEASQ